MITNANLLNVINSPVRKIQAKVELYKGSTLVNTYSYKDALISLSVERAGEENKFFGYGICQKLNFHLIDKERSINITTANTVKILFGGNDTYLPTLPIFSVSRVNRDENTNELSVTAYDALYGAAALHVKDLTIDSYTVEEFAATCSTLLGVAGYKIQGIQGIETCFSTNYESGANFEGTETIREALNMVAEVTQTIYFLDYENKLVFKRLDRYGAAALKIDKSKYFTLESGSNRRLTTIANVTELGDNISASITTSGSTQYVRDNAFWDLREDKAILIDNAVAALGGLTINQFDCSWRGNFLTEIGDKIELTVKDNTKVFSYILNDTIEYNGALSEKTSWKYEEDNAETDTESTSLGETLKQTYAKVDKANKQIQLIAGEVSKNSEAISTLRMNTESISASVSNIQTSTQEAIESVHSDISTLTNKVEATMTPEQLQFLVQNEISDGVNKVTTSTGFTFNEAGLTISKTGSEMETNIDEDGMSVFRDSTEVLTADNQGVRALNLHAVTYLIVGEYSRFEDWENASGEARTGCFWIGG